MEATLQHGARQYDQPAAPAVSGVLRLVSRFASPSIADLIFIGCLVLAIVRGSTMLSADGDPARHLTVGEHILSTRSIPSADVFSHTMAGTAFVPYEWLAEVASAVTFRALGEAGPVLLHGGAIALTFSLLYAHLRRRGHAPLTAVVVTLTCAAVSTVHWLARPHVFTFLGAALTAAALDGWRAGWLSRRSLWLLTPLMVVWANAHGGFLVGVILIFLHLVVDAAVALAGRPATAAPAAARLRQLALPALAALAAPLLNPAGASLWTHVTAYFGKTLLVDLTQEYMAPSPHYARARPFFALLGLLFLSLVIRRHRPGAHDLSIGFTFSAFALYASRNIPLFAVLTAPLLAASLEDLPARRALGPAALRGWRLASGWIGRRNAGYTSIDRRSLFHAWPALVVAAAVALAAQSRDAQPLGITFDPRTQPVGAAAFVAQQPPAGAMFNELIWGGYLLHALWPQHPVFIDGQTDFYGETLAQTYLDIRAAEPGWQAALDRYVVRWVLLEPGAPLVRQLRQDPAWHTLYEDEIAVVVAR